MQLLYMPQNKNRISLALINKTLKNKDMLKKVPTKY